MKKIVALCSLLVLICSTLITGCSSLLAPPDKAYTITIDGVDIVVGKTTVGEFYGTNFILDAEEGQQLEKDMYYPTVFFYDENEESRGWIDIATEKDCVLEDAIIAKVEFDEDYDLASIAERVELEGVKLSDLTLEKAKEIVKRSTDIENGISCPSKNYSIVITFDEDGSILSFKTSKKYSVDWNS